MNNLMIIKIVIIFAPLWCYGMVFDKDNVSRTLALAKLDAISAIFVRDCEELHKPLPYSLIRIRNHYLSIYESKKNSGDAIPRASSEDTGE
jgi:hypothetical protein